MSIVSSEVLNVWPRKDGSQHVQERHIASDGKVYDQFYMASASTDIQAKLAVSAADLEARLAEREIQEILNG
jgi:hypothetical protein